MISKKILLSLVPLFVLTGCSEVYRYPCQDPENWNEKYCQKPYCSANGTCPEDLRHYEKDAPIQRSTPQTQSINKGECK